MPLSHRFAAFLRLGLTAFGGPAMVALRRKVDILWVAPAPPLVSLRVR